MEKPILHVVSLSGGKDSTAMLLRMIEEGMPVDIILFCDTGLEFEGMYNHIDRLEKYIGKPITRLKSPHDFEYLFLEHMPKRNNPELVGNLRGKITGHYFDEVVNQFKREISAGIVSLKPSYIL